MQVNKIKSTTEQRVLSGFYYLNDEPVFLYLNDYSRGEEPYWRLYFPENEGTKSKIFDDNPIIENLRLMNEEHQREMYEKYYWIEKWLIN